MAVKARVLRGPVVFLPVREPVKAASNLLPQPSPVLFTGSSKGVYFPGNERGSAITLCLLDLKRDAPQFLFSCERHISRHKRP